MKVKICGITRREDAAAAVQAGADALGFIFVPSSKRWISPEEARTIIAGLPGHVTPVGVFANASRAEIRDTAERTGIRLIQLHGDESPEQVSGYSLPIWKAFRVGPAFHVGGLAEYRVDGFLLDTYVEGIQGGTGRQFDWEIAIAAKRYGPIILSGGITPDNIAAAVTRVAPFAIDVNSGVESSPGIKDRTQIVRLFNALRRTKESLC
jgi:phosphoribosylanthranilate isomerase